MVHAGCILAAAFNWWKHFRHSGSPRKEDAIHSTHADAARYISQFLLSLDGLVRAHPVIVLRKLSSTFKLLAFIPDWDARWPTRLSSHGEMLRLLGFSVKRWRDLRASEAWSSLVPTFGLRDKYRTDASLSPKKRTFTERP